MVTKNPPPKLSDRALSLGWLKRRPSRLPAPGRRHRVSGAALRRAGVGVNLAATLLAGFVLRWAAKPADEEHADGHAEAE
jgi:hypothetical protein